LSDVQHHTWSESGDYRRPDFVNDQCQQVFRNYIDRIHNVHLLLHVAVFRKWSTVCNPSSLRPPTPCCPRILHQILNPFHKEVAVHWANRENIYQSVIVLLPLPVELSRKNTDHPSPHSEWGIYPSPPQHACPGFLREHMHGHSSKNIWRVYGVRESWKFL
jgi:hypothetical protein